MIPPTPLIQQDNTCVEEMFLATKVSQESKPNYREALSQLNWQTPQFLSHPANVSTSELRAAFWQKMEMRMSQPPPRPTPFDGDSSKYLQFRTNFRDQVENRSSLTDSEKMSYLLSYTTGRAKEVIESYQGLPNACQRSLQVLKQRFGQNSMIVQALKSSVVSGPKLRSGDSAGLLALSDKLENCCWAMTELESNELDCTTNLR